MLGFFRERPAIGLLVVLSFFITGAVMAHRNGPNAVSGPGLALSKKKARPKQAAPAPSWRHQLDLERLRAEDGALVQRLKDGGKLVTTLDPDLQTYAQKLMASYELPYGAMVLTEVGSGRVKVLAGHSSRDKQVDTEALTLTPWAPAASVFKLVTASALLARGVPANATVCYHGGLRGLNKDNIVDNPKLDTACRTLSYAVAKSVNPVMGKLALKYLDAKRLKGWADRYGFNREIPFELPILPSKAAVPTDRLELARVSAGFWHTELSAMHGALIASVAANKGLMRWPSVVSQVVKADGSVEPPDPSRGERVLSRQAAGSLAKMMVRTTTMGTARKAFITRRGRPILGDMKVGGKTGSLSRNDPYLHYSWFVGFAPAQNPKVAFAVLLGNPAKWRIKAHTAARMLLQRYADNRKKAETLALR